ncbi:MAG: 16S rRNA (adenine(1518)-N(6)/adenine(1519)-N(6))-dimethyltransferase RsmA [Acholeplasmatales bacterium]|jgi:16S rRNA (adenine1518-N6/adenine1519-N6)-dimethyltransferase|nr:16S rRNA (adenine(1518)-N(6)/adenine(1519)-N(6))-dimethyltransferase RsmA [Acholeplasmatales bacterium]
MRIKKEYGQNFITDKNLLLKIVSSSNIENKNVIEVGPGKGALTSYIASTAKKVIAYEIDNDLKKYLDVLLTKTTSLDIIYKDFLKVDINNDIKQYFNDEDCILIGNLPYYITSPILDRFLKTPKIKSCVIMIQKEVGDRINAKMNTKEYNALSVTVQYLCNVSKIIDVNKNMFFPIPAVDSIVIKMDKKEITVDNDFINFINLCFTQKRKTLTNNLINDTNYNKEKIENAFSLLNIKTNTRAEELSIDNLFNIYLSLKA